jgi:hypothetical protein
LDLEEVKMQAISRSGLAVRVVRKEWGVPLVSPPDLEDIVVAMHVYLLAVVLEAVALAVLYCCVAVLAVAVAVALVVRCFWVHQSVALLVTVALFPSAAVPPVGAALVVYVCLLVLLVALLQEAYAWVSASEVEAVQAAVYASAVGRWYPRGVLEVTFVLLEALVT